MMAMEATPIADAISDTRIEPYISFFRADQKATADWPNDAATMK
jgi:hypothetical protein